MIGDINLFLSILGCNEGDGRILDVIVKLKMDFSVEKFEFDDVNQTYYHFYKSGVGFTFDMLNNKYILSSIFFYIDNYDNYLPYKDIETLILGINKGSKINNFIKLLGSPVKNSKKWIKYKQENKFIHIEFNDYGKLSIISIFIEK